MKNKTGVTTLLAVCVVLGQGFVAVSHREPSAIGVFVSSCWLTVSSILYGAALVWERP